MAQWGSRKIKGNGMKYERGGTLGCRVLVLVRIVHYERGMWMLPVSGIEIVYHTTEYLFLGYSLAALGLDGVIGCGGGTS